MERKAFHRMMGSSSCSAKLMMGVVNLSNAYDIPINFWFPEHLSHLVPCALPVQKDCVCHAEAPLARKVFEEVPKLDMEDKLLLLKIAQDDALRDLVQHYLDLEPKQQEIYARVLKKATCLTEA